MKGIYLGVPLISVDRAILPFIKQLISQEDMEVVVYNKKGYKSDPGLTHGLKIRAYEGTNGIYELVELSENPSYFEYGYMILSTSEYLMDSLTYEIEKERPDFILHSHLATWGKVIADKFQLPVINLSTSFYLNESIMESIKRPANSSQLEYIKWGAKFQRKSMAFARENELNTAPSYLDVLTNYETKNIYFFRPEFQPGPYEKTEGDSFVGYPVPESRGSPKKKQIYCSLGTVFNRDIEEIDAIITQLELCQIPSILSLGDASHTSFERNSNSLVEIKPYVNQVEVLQESFCFVSRGGMASVHEAIETGTPLIIVPRTWEQIFIGDVIANHNLGICVSHEEIITGNLSRAIQTVLDKHDFFTQQIQKFKHNNPTSGILNNAVQQALHFLYDN